ncbi:MULTISPECIES: 16S rRNA (guanine(966)-N(2))-methyltransferase RsmD [spotted fever group]|uniref:Ribosomal RNA small subunit methyltransferase D n=1 Tax=Rickettsia tamurae subsp. buchneri TaxID=1462938 RepID=A0A8E0WKT2_9RICK|nr:MULTISPECIES: 16S rRNA (guanine(966)-N(2))-methyltransferase RsmD [spotted fever group]EER21977.1 RNA methyltransferase, RsmD family [Rickettsia endosymbiont of Ixodes scapularis]KDO02490.1 Ribosomal RNA small subunit methyltransferase D [Rickettsia tamurae subsp. buchneri]
MLKIISGKYRNQIIPTAKNIKYRPSTDKLKEAIFSILTSGEFTGNKLFNENTHILDLFAGSGSLAFESLSRGAGFATLIDIDTSSLKIAEGFAKSLNIKNNVNFVNINALNLPKANKAFDLVFIDPPYYKDIVPKVMKSLINNNWFKDGTIIVIEMAKLDYYVLDENIEILREKLYGKSKLLVLKKRHCKETLLRGSISPLSPRGLTQWVLPVHATMPCEEKL